MMNQETKSVAQVPNMAKSRIKVTESSNQVTVTIPPKGIKGGALVTVIVIALWLFTILIWTVLLALMKPVNALYSLPFWAIGFWTLFKAIKMIRLQQEIIIDPQNVTLRMSRGSKSEERRFPGKNVNISLIEGSYYDYSGLNKRGQYPAILFNEEAFSFAERNTAEEKKWLIDFLNEKLNNL
jgi:hypothetical protein